MSNNELIVVKHGSSVVEHANGIGTDQRKIDFHVLQHMRLRRMGVDTAEVASGAVVEGKEFVQELGLALEDFDDDEFALHGMPGQKHHWEEGTRPYGITVDQILTTDEKLNDKVEGERMAKYILRRSRTGVLVVMNEDPAAADDEMEAYEEGLEAKERGEDDPEIDNDWMAAYLAIATGAKVLLLLTKEQGFKVDDLVVPKIAVEDIPKMLVHCKGSSRSGTGGMASKLLATKKAAEAGIEVIIGNAFTDVWDLLEGKAGTRVVQ